MTRRQENVEKVVFCRRDSPNINPPIPKGAIRWLSYPFTLEKEPPHSISLVKI